ncbi:MAG: tetratricopeptide repeat protein [Actinomycetota bacterium]|nr:tetratricopeptide repeat protein [Actinomycetota bacterium]
MGIAVIPYHAAAVIGRSFDSETVREASGRSDDEVVTALEELTRRGLIREAGETYDFSHEQVRTLVYEDTSLARRRLLHRRVAEALAAAPRGQLDPGARAHAIARHYQLAGRESEAAEYFKLAGEHAGALYANAEALAHFETALALGHPDVATLHEAIGDVKTLLGDYRGALSSYETAAAQTPGDVAALEQKLGTLHHRRGEWELAASHLEAALAALSDGDDGWRSRLQADRSLTAHRAGDHQRALELARAALELAETVDDESALAQAHNLLGILAKSSGELTRAREHLERSLPLAERLGDPSARVAVLNNLALLAREERDLERAVKLTESALSLCAAQGDRHREAALHNNLADLLNALGRSDEAMAHLKRAVALFAEVGEEGAMQPEIWKLVEW